MAEGGIFLDIFARMNLASMERVLRDVKAAMREGGVSAGRDFSAGLTAGLRDVSRAADLAFRDMQDGLARLQVAESRINDLRAQNFRRSTDAMIAAQRELDTAIVNSQRLMEASTAAAADRRAAVAAVPPRGGEEPRGRGRGDDVIPMSRGANIAGAGAMIGVVGGVVESTRVAADTQRNMQQVMAFHQDAMHNQSYINQQTQAIYEMSTKVPFKPQELSKVYQDIENHGYTGKAALDVLNTSAQTAVATGANLKDTTDGMMTSVKDFGTQAELQSDNVDKYKQGLADLNQMAGQIVVTFGNMKGVNPDEFFRSLGTIEPTAMAAFLGPGSKLSGPQASAQVNSALSLLAQIGIGPEQGSHNVSRIISQLGSVVPGGNLYNMLGQLNIPGGPEGVALATRDKGIFGPLQMIQQAINSKTNPQTGLVDIGWRYNNQQTDALINQDLDQLPPEAKDFVQKHPEIAAGNARPFALKKAAPDAPWLQDVLTLADWYKLKASPNKYTKKGGSTELTPEQVYQQLFGTGDIARTGIALGENAGEGQSMADQLTGVGANALTKGFQDMMKTLPEQWKLLGSSLQALAGQLGEKAIPALTRFVGDLNGAADWLDKHKAAEAAIVGVLGTIAAAWGAAKVVNLFSDVGSGFGKVNKFFNPPSVGGPGASQVGQAGAARGLDGAAGSMSSAATKIDLAATKMDAAATKMDAAGTKQDSAGIKQDAAGDKEVTAAAEMQTAAGEEVSAAGEMMAGGGSMKGAIGMLGAAMFAQNVPKINKGVQGTSWWKQRMALPWYDDPLVHGANAFMGVQNWLGERFSHGGVVGYAGGTDKVADPSSQPLMGQRDTGGDSLLGMLPGGMPVGLRGGEGILTPEAVQALGGKSGVDSLNSNPWADPMKVGTTFYGSFAKGVAKYSPWGKFLEASASGLDRLREDFEGSTKEHEGHRGRSGMPQEIEELLASGMSPEQVEQYLGVKQGKRGGLEMGNGQYMSNTVRGELGIAPAAGRGGATQEWLSQRLIAAGLSPGEARGILAMNSVEGGASSPMSLLGFTEGQAQGPEGHVQAFLNQWNDPSRRGPGGSIPGVGPDGKVGDREAYLTWIRQRIVGQNGSPSDWQGNAQPAPEVYQQGLRNAWNSSQVPWFSRGGVVGFDGGGQIPEGPEYYGEAFSRNRMFAQPSETNWQTHLSTSQEQAFTDWLRNSGAPFDPVAGTQDYDMRGYWQSTGGKGWKRGDHFPDTWKTPYDTTFSNQSKYAKPGTPFSWNDNDQLIDGRTGRPVGYSSGGVVGYSVGTGSVGSGFLPQAPAPGPSPSPGGFDFGGAGTGGPRPGPGLPGTAPGHPPNPDSLIPRTRIDPNAPGTQHPNTPEFKPPEPETVEGFDKKPPAQLTTKGDQPGNYPTTKGDRNVKENPSQQLTAEGKGFGVSGGILGAAEGAASSMMPFGSGAGAQIAFQLMNRAIGYGGQLVGIGLEGLMETFLPNDDPAADPSKNIFGKMALGIAGSHPSGGNMAGKSAQQFNPKGDLDQGAAQAKQVMPMVHIENSTIHHNGPGDTHKEMESGIRAGLMGLPVGGQA